MKALKKWRLLVPPIHFRIVKQVIIDAKKANNIGLFSFQIHPLFWQLTRRFI